jgi:serine O-acetyltransferase
MIKTDTATFPNVLRHVVDKLPSSKRQKHAKDWHAGEEEEAGVTSHSAPDAIWAEISASAARMALKEPYLSPLLRRLVLRQSSLLDSLIAVLAHQMRSKELSEALLCKLMRAVFRSEESMVEWLAKDFAAVKGRDPACPDYLHVLLNLKGFHALQVHRLSHQLWKQDRKELAFHIANTASRVYSIDIHPAARIGSGVMLDHGTGIVIGETTVIEDNVSLLQNVTLGGTGKQTGDRHPKVRSGVMIGAGSKILGNIEIGSMSKVAAGSVVLHPVPPNCTVAGVPARVVRQAAGKSAPSFEMDQSV